LCWERFSLLGLVPSHILHTLRNVGLLDQLTTSLRAQILDLLGELVLRHAATLVTDTSFANVVVVGQGEPQSIVR
jgi:hypothetical protein